MSTNPSAYPPGPASIPENLTAATPRYRRHAWIAVAALLLFAFVYVGLAVWFCWQAWHMLSSGFAGGEHAVQGFILGIPSAFLAAFMIKGLFFVKQGGESQDIELTAADQPALFEFLYKLADEAQAPRPHRVYASAAVNAAVFYDLSIINFLFPSRKNLEIGLALVNVLTLGELKAVLAHEFGHFAQRSMAVGRWVYIAQQIAGHMVARRDGFDRFLAGLARLDIRIAWVGWLLSLIVWSIRSLIELSFRLLLLAQRALSREMEMQADLVAVSLTGSDALMHALHKMSAADDAWSRTIAFANREYGKGRQVADLLSIQSRIIDHLRVAYDDLQYGRAPQAPENEPAAHRVFKVDFARPPQMWSTHPLNHEREQNAKKTYVAAPLDNRSAWTVFHDAKGLRERVSTSMIKQVKSDAALESEKDAIENLDLEYRQEFLNRFYRSAYLGRSVVRHARTLNELYENFAPLPAGALARIYPAELSAELETLRELQRETAMLKAILDGAMQAAGSATRYRGRDLRSKDLPAAIAEAEQELAALESRIYAHDRLCRSAHLAVARQFGGGWDLYLKSLLGLMHYADHSAADLRDMQAVTANVFQVVTAGGKLNKEKFKRLMTGCQELFASLAAAYAGAAQVAPGAAVLKRMEVESWPAQFGQFTFAAPSDSNINDWLNNVDSWANAAHANFRRLYEAALGELLKTEAQLAKAAHTAGAQLEAAPAAATYPAAYPVLVPGDERPKQKKLDWWSRFQRADGPFAAIGKLAVAASLVAAVLLFGMHSGRADLTIYNGLESPVQVTVGSEQATVQAKGFADLKLPSDDDVDVRAAIGNTEIEHFKQHVDNSLAHYVYNVANAAVFVQWAAVYGNARAVEPQSRGNPRWSEVNVDHLFTQPPRSVQTKAGGATRTVLSSLSGEPPAAQLNELKNRADVDRIVQTHVRYDPPDSGNLGAWLSFLQKVPQSDEVLAARLRRYPNDVYALRLEQDIASPQQRPAICQRHAEAARQAPENADLQYLALRCMPHGEAQAQAFTGAADRWPRNPWLQLASGYTALNAGRFDEAMQRFAVTFAQMPASKEWVNVDIARARRLRDPNAAIGDLQAGSFQLDTVHDLETNPKLTGVALAWSEFVRGNLAKAHQLAPAGRDGLSLAILLAASDGAPAEWADQVLRIAPDQSWSQDMLWYGLALATRQQRDTAPYLTLLTANADETGAQMAIFYRALQAGKPFDPGTRLADTSLRDRGLDYALALVVKGRAAPSAWRDDAKRLLFGTERPYFE